MRDPLLLVSAAAIVGGLTLGPAIADPRPGWVDPPAKPAAQAQPPAGADKPASPEASGPPDQASAPKAASETATKTAPDPSAAASQPPAAAIGGRRMLAGEGRGRSIRRTRNPVTATPSLAAGPAPAADDLRFPDWASRAQRLALDYLDNVSAPNAESLAAAPRFYGPRVRRFGKTESLAAVLAEKRRFAKRWPERLYAARAEAIRTSCNAAVKACIVRATFDYRARNPARGLRSQGTAELVLEISFSDGRPVIVSESGRVLRRAASATLVDARAKPGA